MHCGARLQESAMATHQEDNGAADIDSEYRHQNRCDYAPHDQGMPFPLPYLVNQAQRMMAQMLDLFSVQRQAASMEEMYAQLDEGNKQEQVERGDRVGSDL